MDSSLFSGNLVESNRIIYTASVFAMTSLIHLQEIGTLQAKKAHESRRENLSSYLFFIVISGSGELEYGGITYKLSAGDCVFLDCKKAYSHKTSDDLWKLKWIHFYGPNMNGIYEKYTERGGKPRFKTCNIDKYEMLFEQIFSLASSSDYIRDMRIYEKMTSLLTLLMEESWNPDESKIISRQKQNLQKVKEYLDIHYSEKINLDKLADKFYINKFYLTRIFKEQFGISINGYLMQIRITKAKRLLRFSELTIEEIGAKVGMSDSNYFSRIFKKYEGVSPSKFKKMW